MEKHPLLVTSHQHLHTWSINRVYASCKAWRTVIDENYAWLYDRCEHVLPHSHGDRPLISKKGHRYWYRDGKLHRVLDLPAVEKLNGKREWYRNGKQHRGGDLPAVIEGWRQAEKERDCCTKDVASVTYKWTWWRDGKVHRDGDLPAVIWSEGTVSWFTAGRVTPPDRPHEAGKWMWAEWWLNGEFVQRTRY